jgi:regulatory protein
VSSTAFETAVRLLKSRAKSRARLELALEARGHSAEQISEAIARVTSLGYLDDGRYAEAKARSAISEGRSIADVERRLAADGIAPELATSAARAAAHEAGHDDLSAARALVKKRKLSGVKAARLLASRGFDEDVISRVVGDSWPLV